MEALEFAFMAIRDNDRLIIRAFFELPYRVLLPELKWVPVPSEYGNSALEYGLVICPGFVLRSMHSLTPMSTPRLESISTCATRKQLEREFRVLLDSYNETLLTRMNEVGLEAATRLMNEQYQCCLKAREALRTHELEHHCYSLPPGSESTEAGRFLKICMEPMPRHQCIIYEGSPAKYLPGVAQLIKHNLRENTRCLYLNSPPMVLDYVRISPQRGSTWHKK